MPPVITPVYAAIAAIFYFVLCVNVARTRRVLRIPIGDGGDERMIRAMRIHANFIEYTPLVLLMLLMMELQGIAHALIHAGGLLLLVGRLVHAFGVRKSPENFRFREAGMALTFTAMIGSASAIIGTFLLG